MRSITSISVCLLLMIACNLRFVRVKDPKLIAKYISTLEAYNERVFQLKATLDIKMSGLIGSFIHEQADIVIKTPQYFYWSIRSFFGPPSMVLAGNGEYITIYDFTGQNDKVYQKIPQDDSSFFELLDFRFQPKMLTNLFLVKIPLNGAKDLEINVVGDTLEIKGLIDGFYFRSIFDHCNLRILKTELSNNEMGISYQIKYDKFYESDGIDFPHSLQLTAKGASRFAKFNIELVNVELNGEPVSPDIFYLRSE